MRVSGCKITERKHERKVRGILLGGVNRILLKVGQGDKILRVGMRNLIRYQRWEIFAKLTQ